MNEHADFEADRPAATQPKDIRVAGMASRFPMPRLGGALFLLVLSAFWVESDLYRYALGILLLWALWVYGFRSPVKVAIGWAGWLCIGWAGFVAARLAYGYVVDPTSADGHSEGLYLFPLFFITTGFAMFLSRASARQVMAAFFLVSAVLLAVSTDFAAVFAGTRQKPLYHSNAIHGAVSVGFILIGATIWLSHLIAGDRPYSRLRRLAIALAAAVAALATLNVLSADSKGVWLALVPVAAVAPIMVIVQGGRRQVAILVAAAALVAASTFAFGDRLADVSGATVKGMALLAESIVAADHPVAAVHAIVEAKKVPESSRLRLELWLNAWDIWSNHLWFGAATQWDDLMRQARYHGGGYTTLHNGYLEIAVRYGIVGLFIVLTIVGFCLRSVFRAGRRGLLPPVAFPGYVMLMTFFLATNLTNSNSHYAFGETFILLASGFGFCCFYLIQYDDHLRKAGLRR